MHDTIYSITGLALFGFGFFGVLAAQHIIKHVIAINIMGIGIFMVLLATAYHGDAGVDPVPHAMVLTGIVVAVAGSALCLWLAVSIGKLQAHDTTKHEGKAQRNQQV